VVVIEKTRHGRFFGVGGNMPLYSLEALSDEDLGALLAYLGL
jgi:thiosulfate dehydrogenase